MSLAHPSGALGSTSTSANHKTLALMCADAPDEGWGPDEAAIFASRFGAYSQRGDGIDFVLSFTEPARALRAAVVWQRLSAGTRPRLALHMVEWVDDQVQADADDHRWIQDAIDQGSRLAREAAAGTIALSADAYGVIREQITREVRDALVMTEMDEDEVTQASILLAPKSSAELSTFAGLGLT